jgi:ABC-type branched-subunit amino acid transport system permease subunit
MAVPGEAGSVLARAVVGSLSLTEGLRVWFGANFIGAANAIYGVLLLLFVIFMPRGMLGWPCVDIAAESPATTQSSVPPWPTSSRRN